MIELPLERSELYLLFVLKPHKAPLFSHVSMVVEILLEQSSKLIYGLLPTYSMRSAYKNGQQHPSESLKCRDCSFSLDQSFS
jgi:hypothetical protein